MKRLIASALLAALAQAAGAVAGEPPRSAGGVAFAEPSGGVTDTVYVVAPPNYAYVIARAPGSFLDCGTGAERRATDADGRDAAALFCGVSLTETVATPDVGAPARLFVHY